MKKGHLKCKLCYDNSKNIAAVRLQQSIVIWTISVVMLARKTQSLILKLVHLQQDRSPFFSVTESGEPKRGHSQPSKSQPVISQYNHVWEKYNFLQDFLNKRAIYNVSRNKGITLMPSAHCYIMWHAPLPSLSPSKSASELK